MRKRIHLYGLLLVATLIQAVCMKHTPWFPDIILLMVVFTYLIFGVFALFELIVYLVKIKVNDKKREIQIIKNDKRKMKLIDI